MKTKLYIYSRRKNMRVYIAALVAFGVSKYFILSTFTLGNANADTMPATIISKTTDEGWHASVMTFNEQVSQINNIASSKSSHEAFVNLDVRAVITGNGLVPVQQAQLTAGYQIGCQTDLSSGFELAGSIAGRLAGHDNTSTYVNGHAQVGLEGVGAKTGVTSEAGLDPSGDIAGAAQKMFRPGAIVDIPLDQITLLITQRGSIGKLSPKYPYQNRFLRWFRQDSFLCSIACTHCR